jgi:hypothetical protein
MASSQGEESSEAWELLDMKKLLLATCVAFASTTGAMADWSVVRQRTYGQHPVVQLKSTEGAQVCVFNLPGESLSAQFIQASDKKAYFNIIHVDKSKLFTDGEVINVKFSKSHNNTDKTYPINVEGDDSTVMTTISDMENDGEGFINDLETKSLLTISTGVYSETMNLGLAGDEIEGEFRNCVNEITNVTKPTTSVDPRCDSITVDDVNKVLADSADRRLSRMHIFKMSWAPVSTQFKNVCAGFFETNDGLMRIMAIITPDSINYSFQRLGR